MERARSAMCPARKRPGGQDQRAPPGAGILRMDCGKPRRSSVDFRVAPGGLSAQVEPPSPQPSVDRLSVTFAEKSDCSESSVKVNVFDPGSPPSQVQEMDKVRFCSAREESDGENEDEDDYSASVSVIMQRRESMRRASSKKRKRRSSSPFSGIDGEGLFDGRRRSSVYTNSSGETAISIEDGAAQEQIFENIRLHKEVLGNAKLQPWGMRRKIKLVQQAKAYVKRHEGELQERLAMSKSTKDIVARFNIWLVKKLQYIRRELANTMTLLIPWELRIKEIESHFGSAVASYFTFLRWMFWVNLVITVILACFVAIPEMLTADVKNAGERKEMLPEEKLTATNLATLWDFEGVLKYSPIFYGYYTNKDGPGTGYRLPFAYFMTGLAVYVYSFVATLRRMAENSRMSKLSEKDDEYLFTWKLFTGWDYMIGNAETAHNRVASLILGFKEALLEETERRKTEKNWKVICIRVLVSFLVIGLLVFSAYVVFIVVERSTEPEADDTWWRQNEITVSLSIISLIFPIFFELLGFLEGYHPRKSLRIQLARIMVLNLLNLYTLIFSQFWKISKMAVELQSLKANYSAMFGDAMSILPSGNLTPNCYYVALNCSNPGAMPESPKFNLELASVANAKALHPLLNGTDSFNESSGDFSDTFPGGVPGAVSESVPNAGSEITTFYSSFEAEETPGEEKKSSSAFPNPFTAFYSSHSFGSVVTNVTGVWNDGTNSSDARATEFLPSNATDAEVRKTETEMNPREVLSKNTSTSPGAPADDSSSPGRNVCYEMRCEIVRSDEVRTKILTDSEMTGSMFDMETRRKLRRLCWETMFGQELIKLTVMDLVLTILSVMLLDFFRAVFVRLMNNCWCWDLEKKFPQYGDFKIAENILHLVNNQGMVWMGMFFSPGLPAINLIKLVIMMYLRSWAVLTCNVPHEVVFRASRSNNFYLALLLTMLFLCVLPVGFAIVWIEPSWHCGPFSDYKRIYHLFTESLQKALPETFHKALDYVASPGIIIPLLTLLVLIIYYLVSLTNSLREANNDLKIQLRRERTEERRKMFQLVDKRARKGSRDSEMPFARWKKVLPELSPRPAAQTTNKDKGEKTENGILAVDLKKDVNKKELLTRLMKRALRKSSVTSDDDTPVPEEVADLERQDSQFEDGAFWPKGGKKLVESNRKWDKNAPEKCATDEAETQAQIRNISPTRSRSKPAKVGRKSPQRNSLISDWSENIPVITISKTESEESIANGIDAEDEKNIAESGPANEEAIAVAGKEEKGGKANEERDENRSENAAGTAKEIVPNALTTGKELEKEENSNKFRDDTENSVLDKEQEEKCPIATEDTVSSDLDISQGSLVGERIAND